MIGLRNIIDGYLSDWGNRGSFHTVITASERIYQRKRQIPVACVGAEKPVRSRGKADRQSWNNFVYLYLFVAPPHYPTSSALIRPSISLRCIKFLIIRNCRCDSGITFRLSEISKSSVAPITFAISFCRLLLTHSPNLSIKCNRCGIYRYPFCEQSGEGTGCYKGYHQHVTDLCTMREKCGGHCNVIGTRSGSLGCCNGE